MKYIKTIEIINFQSHKYSKLNFEDGYNVICGPSDSGKSAIIRALRWALYNEPKGTEFITQGENTCKVSITFSDGITIVRERSKNRNIYRLINTNGEEMIFEGFGNDIPKEILAAHGINKVYIDIESPESINLSSQLEGPFLIDKSGSIKAKAIGKLVGVHIIDEALKELNKDLFNVQSDVKRLSKEYENINIDLKEFENLENVRKSLDESEKKLEELKNKYTKLERLKNIKRELIAIDSEIKETKDLIISIGDMDYVFNLACIVQTKITTKNKLTDLKNKFMEITEEIKCQNKVLIATKHIDDCVLNLIEAVNNCNKTNELKKLNMQYKLLVNEIRQLNLILSKLKNINDAKETLSKYESQYDNYNKLTDIKSRLNEINNSLKIGYKYISKFDNLEKADLSYKAIQSNNEKSLKLNIIKNNLLKIDSELICINDEIKICNNNINNYIKEYTKVLKELGKCPLCLSPIEEHTIKKIINEL
ncbi:hypothetical protein FDN13_00510 [Caloramator sp. E03]|uniref:AAA family ATPase n=1 Tax=Caloramator sp. E03 TaxID=2576307 RepID=UPI00111019F3|nr:AAA family ATPase [Caloramator sp. E03]QCX32298.1 hypothetical protein FDN13_00510 [Caloramator sp. E03]